MTELLNRAYPLTTIGASLDLDTEQDRPLARGVHVEVDVPGGVRLQRDLSLQDLGIPLDLYGIDRSLATDGPLDLPRAWLEQLRAALEPVAPGEPVWLDFRRPFGHLPAMPWERLLQPHLGVPLLRLPFSAIPAAATTNALSVTVCAPWAGTAALREYLSTVVPSLPGARFDVFTLDHEARSDVPAGAVVLFHDPPSEDPATVPVSSSSGGRPDDDDLDNGWLRWMADTMAPQSVDVLHVICGARVSRNYGLLDFSQSPTGPESDSPLRMVGVAQLLACLTQLGAWSLSLALADVRATSHGEAGLRIFGHRMTGLLSGPVTLQAPAAGHADELAAAYRFLYTPGPQPAPLTPTLALACHPTLARSKTGHPSGSPEEQELARALEGTVSRCTVDADVLQAARQDPSESSAWVTSSQRLLERWTSTAVGGTEDPAASVSSNRGVTDALAFISSVIEDTVRGKGRDR